MYGLITKLLVSGKLKFKEGEIDIFGEPFAFVPMASIIQMTRDAMKEGKRSINKLYFYGWVYGFVVTLGMVKKFKLKKFEERYKISMDIAALVGFGDYQTLNFKPGHSHFKTIKNPFALEFYPSKVLVDHYLRGMNAGGGAVVHEEIMNCIESKCAAQNGSFCLFDNASPDEMDKLDQKLVKSQLEYNYLLKRQRELILECREKPKKYGL
jgi:hypothetical protein